MDELYLEGDTTLEVLARAAPLLQVLEADVNSTWDRVLRALRPEPPLAQLQLRTLRVQFSDEPFRGAFGGIERVAPVAAALADAALQPTLTAVEISGADVRQPEVLDALVDAVLARRLPKLQFWRCTPPAAAPLARLLAGGALKDLNFSNLGADDRPLFDVAGAAVVANALRATTALTPLELAAAGLCRDGRVAAALLGALVGHRSLRSLDLNFERDVEDPAALGAALAALVAADASALQTLSAWHNALGDDGLAPLVDALPRNTHLRTLDISWNGMSGHFAQHRLLPAVRANTGLRYLSCNDRDDTAVPAAVVAAQRLLKRRPR